MMEPFRSVSLVLIIQEDALANRLQLYENRGWDHLISNWKNALSRDVAAHLGLCEGSLKHYGINSDVNGIILMADIILYCSSQDEQGFPPLMTRAMSFGIPLAALDYPVITKYVFDGVHGIIVRKKDPTALIDAFSLLTSGQKLSRYAHSVASSGRLHAKNMFAAESFTGYAKLLEYVFDFPSDVFLPSQASHLNSSIWEWNLFRRRSLFWDKLSIVYSLEEGMTSYTALKISTQNKFEKLEEDFPTMLDWNILN